jgi:general control protein GCN4
VPLFQSNTTGNIPASQNKQTVNLSDITMGGSGTSASLSANMSSPSLTSLSANVAYHDTMGDLGAFENGASFGDFNMFTDLSALNQATTNSLTVSPKDLFNGADSVPPSTSFTNLTTPGSTYLETPESYSASPLFNDTLDNTFDFSSNCNSTNFFPELDSLVAAPSMERTVSNSSNNPIVVHPGGPAHSRKRSSTTASPAAFVRLSSVAGVGAKKRDKPLPPILVDEHDTVALKRARNTAAARKSRAKKVEERDILESRIAELEGLLATQTRETEYWKAKAQGANMDDLSD